MTNERAEGVTQSERYLKSLCDKTFLSLWSYPGIYRDQNKTKAGDGKEICDLIVVFENNIIIFSDKDCRFPNSGCLATDWNRWFKRAVYKSAEQAWGAERWIKSFPNRLFLDRSCSQRFPIQIPDLSQARFHLIVVAHNYQQRSQDELGGKGSLMIDSSIQSSQHYASVNERCFAIGDIEPTRSFVHVLGDQTLDIVLKTVDTVSDFVNYLERKEALLRSLTHVVAFGEEDLLAYYLSNVNQEGRHDFAVWDSEGNTVTPNALFFEEGHWEKFCHSEQRDAQLRADRVSYVWDALIEEHSRHIVSGTHYFRTGSDLGEAETLLRWLAREPRLRRRALSIMYMEFIELAPRNQRATRYVMPTEPGQPHYLFMTLPVDAASNYSNYRRMRRELVEISGVNLKAHHPEARHAVGLATEPGIDNGGRSHDAAYIDLAAYSAEEVAEIAAIASGLEMLSNPTLKGFSVDEYPAVLPRPKNAIRKPKGFGTDKNQTQKPSRGKRKK
jgi:hypothetical protein